MKKIILSAIVATGLMADGLTFGVDTGKYDGDGYDITATQIRGGVTIGHVTPYIYAQRDTITVSGVSISENSKGAGVDFNYEFDNGFGAVAGVSYGEGDLLGYEYKDTTVKAGGTYSISKEVFVEAGVKRKKYELLGEDDDHDGVYVGVGLRFGE